MGDSNFLSTGYSSQTKSILKYLASKPSKYEIIHQSWHYMGMPVDKVVFEDGETLNYKIVPGGQHPWGKDVLPQYLSKFKPDIFFVLADSFMLAQDGPNGPVNYWFNQINTSPAKTIMYFPSDGEPFPLGCDNVLRKFDYNVAMAKFGQEQVKRLYNIDTMYIPHNIDCNLFYKMNNKKQELKVKWSSKCFDSNFQRCDLTNKRIILCVARNQGRKMLSFVPKIMAELKKDKKYDDVIFLMKSTYNDPASGGVDMISLCKEFGVADRVVWVDCEWFTGFTLTEMREIYNLAELFALPTSGEGTGVPFLESLACELPIVAPDFTTPREIVDGDERQLSPVPNTLTGTYNVERGLANPIDMAEKIKFFLDNPEVAKETGKKNRLKALKEYDSKVVLPKWDQLFSKIVNE